MTRVFEKQNIRKRRREPWINRKLYRGIIVAPLKKNSSTKICSVAIIARRVMRRITRAIGGFQKIALAGVVPACIPDQRFHIDTQFSHHR
jgi:hypothetical protein